MGTFLIALSAVAVLLLTAAPGFVFIKKNMVSRECMPGLSKILLFVCQPSLAIYTFSSVSFSLELIKSIGIFVLAAIAIHAVMLGAACLIIGKKFSDVKNRIFTIAVSFANCAFFGIPIIEAVFGEAASGLIVYTTVYALVMNILGWTAGSAIISSNMKHMKPIKILVNPSTIGVLIALPLFLFSITLPSELLNMITLLGKMTTPLSMLIMGMRLATMNPGDVFLSARGYITSAIKLVVMPLVAFLIIFAMPLSSEIKGAFYIMCSCPTASIVLNFSEIIGEGQKEAAGSVLLTTVLSIVTLPFMMLLLALL